MARSDAAQLPIHVLKLLQACDELGTDITSTLSVHLTLTEHTINTYFKRANEVFGTRSRFEAVSTARRLGLLDHSQ